MEWHHNSIVGTTSQDQWVCINALLLQVLQLIVMDEDLIGGGKVMGVAQIPLKEVCWRVCVEWGWGGGCICKWRGG
jgi:hypothetical protein